MRPCPVDTPDARLWGEITFAHWTEILAQYRRAHPSTPIHGGRLWLFEHEDVRLSDLITYCGELVDLPISYADSVSPYVESVLKNHFMTNPEQVLRCAQTTIARDWMYPFSVVWRVSHFVSGEYGYFYVDFDDREPEADLKDRGGFYLLSAYGPTVTATAFEEAFVKTYGHFQDRLKFPPHFGTDTVEWAEGNPRLVLSAIRHCVSQSGRWWQNIIKKLRHPESRLPEDGPTLERISQQTGVPTRAMGRALAFAKSSRPWHARKRYGQSKQETAFHAGLLALFTYVLVEPDPYRRARIFPA